MSIGQDYVSELRPPTDPLVIPQVIYEHGQPWWNDIDRGKLIIPPELSGNLTSSYLAAEQEKRELLNFAC
jgi:hypothetical protein